MNLEINLRSILLASQSGLDQTGVFGSQKLQSETGSWEEIRLGPTLMLAQGLRDFLDSEGCGAGVVTKSNVLPRFTSRSLSLRFFLCGLPCVPPLHSVFVCRSILLAIHVI